MGKKFLIIGNTNAIACKEIFPYIKENKLWLGVSSFNTGMYFGVPDNYQYAATYKFAREINGEKVMRVSSICWYTNIEHDKRNHPLDFYKHYSNEYHKYDNYDAIEVSRVADIPVDYYGVMGVPITYIQYHSQDQFEIVGIDRYVEDNPIYGHRFHLNGKEVYARILIRRKDRIEPADFEIVDAREVALSDKQRMKSTMLIKDADGAIDGKNTYARICIRRK